MTGKKARLALQRVAAGLLRDPEAAKQKYRVVGCARNMTGDQVQIYRTVTGDNARYASLVTCGSVWHCPVCAAKITEQRRADLQQAINAWAKQGGAVFLMTLTFPHEFDMPLAELTGKFAKALQKFKNCRAFKRVMEQHGRAGSVRSLEVTVGQNGWHPHTHELIFAREGMLEDMRAMDELRHAWVNALLKCGLGGNDQLNDMLQYAFDFQGGDYAAEYVAKFGQDPKLYEEWGAASELTKQHAKIGRGAHLSPFGLLQHFAETGDERSAALFREYAEQFQGKRMLFWSPKLRQKLALGDEREDDEIAAAEDPLPEEELVCQLTIDQWRLVLSRNARFEVLFWAAKYGADGVLAFLDELKERPTSHNSTFFKKNTFGGGFGYVNA